MKSILVILLLNYISNAFNFNKYNSFKASYHQKSVVNIQSSTDSNSVDNKDDINPENSQITRLFELIVTSLEDGREDDLVKTGLKVTKKSARETLDNKINDPKLQDLVLGPMNDPDEIDVMQRLQQVYLQQQEQQQKLSSSSSSNNNNNIGYDDEAGEIDEDVLNDLTQEAYQTLQVIRQQSNGVSAMGKLLDDQEGFSSSSNVNEFKGFGNSNSNNNKSKTQTEPTPQPKQQQQPLFDPSVWDATTSVGVASLLSPVDTIRFPEFADTSASDSASTSSSIPMLEFDIVEEVDEIEDYDDDSSDDVDVGVGGSSSSMSRRDGSSGSSSSRSSSALFMTAQDDDNGADSNSNNDKSQSNKSNSAVPTEADAVALSAVGESPEAKFAALLRASMTMQQAQTEAENESETKPTVATSSILASTTASASESTVDDSIAERRRRTVDAVTAGRVDKLDMDALLGKTMATLAKQLDIDVQGSLTEKESLQQMQSIIGSGMAELTQGLSEVDAQSQALYQQLENMQIDLRNETEVFEQTKQMELDMFMKSQRVFQNEVVLSQKRMQNTTDTLKNLVQSLEEEADVLSAIVLFPLKSIDKQIAFVFGLALLFKVPFDGFRVALNSLDSSDWFGVIIQAAVCLACFNHYGLLKAAFQNNSNQSGGNGIQQ